ncbi:unnamed protein product [Linum trigynum]|uniref:F-box associated domain-containing protein n=1 Tax=Linum trigynum TaxID=586398 RepID=A0AAV2DPL5_9ROSI
MFCSDTGEWTKDILVLREHCQFSTRNVGFLQRGGVLVLWRSKSRAFFIAAFNPFHPDIPPTAIEPPLVFGKPGWDVGVSQGALHIIVFEDRIEPGRSQITLSVWRLEDDRKSWGKVCDGSMKGPRLCELRTNLRPCLHPEKPQVLYLRHSDGSGDIYALSCDLGGRGRAGALRQSKRILQLLVFVPI